MGKDKSGNFLVDFTMAGIAACVSKTAMAPMERVKLIMQTQDNNPAIVVKYKSIGDCFRRVIAEEGVKTLWNGNLANVVRYMPTQAFNLAFKDKYKAYFTRGLDKKNQKMKFALASITSGGLAGMSSYPLVYPLDYARTRLSTQKKGKDGKKMYNGLVDCILKSVKTEGVTGVYKGYVIANIGIFVYRGVQFGIYDIEKQYILQPMDVQNPILLRVLRTALAFNAATLSGLCSYPIDTVRRRMFMDVGKKVKTYNGTMDCFMKIAKNEGVNGLWKGAASNIARGFGATLVLVIYDDAKAWAMRTFLGH